MIVFASQAVRRAPQALARGGAEPRIISIECPLRHVSTSMTVAYDCSRMDAPNGTTGPRVRFPGGGCRAATTVRVFSPLPAPVVTTLTRTCPSRPSTAATCQPGRGHRPPDTPTAPTDPRVRFMGGLRRTRNGALPARSLSLARSRIDLRLGWLPDSRQLLRCYLATCVVCVV